MDRAELARGLEIDERQLGRGYGHPTSSGLAAMARAGALSAALDTTYSAKSVAGLLARATSGQPCERLFWSTKSSAPLPDVAAAELESSPRRMLRWLGPIAEGSHR
jgi:hypothetical protein